MGYETVWLRCTPGAWGFSKGKSFEAAVAQRGSPLTGRCVISTETVHVHLREDLGTLIVTRGVGGGKDQRSPFLVKKKKKKKETYRNIRVYFVCACAYVCVWGKSGKA